MDLLTDTSITLNQLQLTKIVSERIEREFGRNVVSVTFTVVQASQGDRPGEYSSARFNGAVVVLGRKNDE